MYGPCFSSIVGGHPLRSPTRHRLGELLPHQLADGTQAPPEANVSFYHKASNPRDLMGHYRPFRAAIPHFGAGHQRVTHPFATKDVLLHPPFDLHVLGTPPAFILSQDQTLRKNFISFEISFNFTVYSKRQDLLAFYHYSVVKVPSACEAPSGLGAKKYRCVRSLSTHHRYLTSKPSPGLRPKHSLLLCDLPCVSAGRLLTSGLRVYHTLLGLSSGFEDLFWGSFFRFPRPCSFVTHLLSPARCFCVSGNRL